MSKHCGACLLTARTVNRVSSDGPPCSYLAVSQPCLAEVIAEQKVGGRGARLVALVPEKGRGVGAGQGTQIQVEHQRRLPLT
jgi:hypothetical protein